MSTPTTPTASAPESGSELRVETWECRACGEHVPCKISITYEPLEWAGGQADAHERFRRRRCVCDEPRPTDWKHIQNNEVTDRLGGGSVQ